MAKPRVAKPTDAELNATSQGHWQVWARYFAAVMQRKVRKHGKECECSLCEALDEWYGSY